MANIAYLQALIETDRFYGGNNTVEQTIKLHEHDMWLDCGGQWGIIVDENPREVDVEDYLEAWDDFCEGKCVGWVD